VKKLAGYCSILLFALVAAEAFAGVPAAPTGLSAVANFDQAVYLAWTNHGTNITSIGIQRSTDGKTFSPLTTLPGRPTQYFDNPVSASTTYYYRIYATNPSGNSPFSKTASDTTTIHVMNDPNAVLTEPTLAKPAYLTAYKDPLFSTHVMRTTGDPGASFAVPSGATGNWGLDARHNYMLNEPWNSDQSDMLVENEIDDCGIAPTDSQNTSTMVIDGAAYTLKMGIPSVDPDSSGDHRWHPIHATELMNIPDQPYNGQNLAWLFDLSKNKLDATFPLPLGPLWFGNSKGNISSSGRYVAMLDTTLTKLWVLDAVKNVSGPIFDLTAEGLGGTVSWAAVASSGKYYVLHYNPFGTGTGSTDAIRIFTVNLNAGPKYLTLSRQGYSPSIAFSCAGNPANGFVYSLGHADVGYNPFDNNVDVILGQNECSNSGTTSPLVHSVNADGIGNVIMVRLKDGRATSLSDPGNGSSVAYEAWAYHTSMRATRMPGWAFISYGNDTPGNRFYGEVVAVKLDGSGSVARLGHLHSVFLDVDSNGQYTEAHVCQSKNQTLNYVNPPKGYPTSCSVTDTDFEYRSEPHCAPSRDGKRVVCASNYLSNATGGSCNIQDYVFDLR